MYDGVSGPEYTMLPFYGIDGLHKRAERLAPIQTATPLIAAV